MEKEIMQTFRTHICEKCFNPYDIFNLDKISECPFCEDKFDARYIFEKMGIDLISRNE